MKPLIKFIFTFILTMKVIQGQISMYFFCHLVSSLMRLLVRLLIITNKSSETFFQLTSQISTKCYTCMFKADNLLIKLCIVMKPEGLFMLLVFALSAAEQLCILWLSVHLYLRHKFAKPNLGMQQLSVHMQQPHRSTVQEDRQTKLVQEWLSSSDEMF